MQEKVYSKYGAQKNSRQPRKKIARNESSIPTTIAKNKTRKKNKHVNDFANKQIQRKERLSSNKASNHILKN